MKYLKYAGIAAIGLAWSMGLAQAQTATAGGGTSTAGAPAIGSASALRALVKPGVMNGIGTSGAGPSFSGSGLYYRHCVEAIFYDDGTNYGVYAYNVEGDEEYALMPHAGSGNSAAQTLLTDVCRSGGGYYIEFSGSTWYELWQKAY
jgi:hypothetical protein